MGITPRCDVNARGWLAILNLCLREQPAAAEAAVAVMRKMAGSSRGNELWRQRGGRASSKKRKLPPPPRDRRNSSRGPGPGPDTGTQGLHKMRIKGEGGISHVFVCTGTRKPPLKWGNTTHVRRKDKKSFGDQGILSFEQTIKRDDRTETKRDNRLVPRSYKSALSDTFEGICRKFRKSPRLAYILRWSVPHAKLRLANHHRESCDTQAKK